jgi:cytochrome c peroxidase
MPIRLFHVPTVYALLLLILAAIVIQSEVPNICGKDLSVVLLQGSDTESKALPNAKVELGRVLFFDKRLSKDGTVSCATCHDPAWAFASREPVATGVRGLKGTRNAPTLLNSFFSTSYFGDGRALTLDEQAKQPLLNDKEMGMETEAAVVQRVAAIDEYRRAFRRIFRREGITLASIANAIATFERTLVSRTSPFDRFIAGNKNAISDAEKQGWQLFKGKAKCIECHTFSAVSPFFTDFKFYNTGIGARGKSLEDLTRRLGFKDLDPARLAHQPEFSDLGRFLVTRAPKDIGAFKTPTLRDVELTGPYMHDGSIKTVLDVLKFYNEGGVKNPFLHARMQPLNLTDVELNQLAEFLRALTSDDILRLVQSSKPQTREPVPLQAPK